ncbi:MAG TPA: hypothetical protein VMB84_10205 [Stellaceae bacterium]|nr:hypothetical protein [Stellaceae bacterium]
MAPCRPLRLALCLAALLGLAACAIAPGSGDWFGEVMHPGQAYDPGTD